MAEPNKCPQCGTSLPSGALAGLCPACLLKAGASEDTVTDAKQGAFTPPSVPELAAKFPQLEILELIGKGGMGAVYKARQRQLDRIVALKILPPGIGDDPAFAERFAREAKALAKLNHPNIVTLYEFGDAGGQFYFLMEFVDGVNLRQLLHAGRISPREALAIVPQICDALQFAHDQGIVHRDIKPENILLDRRGRVKVADFGLAKIMEGEGDGPALTGQIIAGSTTLTDAGKLMGTPQYMSPEQKANPAEVDHRADIYALGVVFYQMLTGELPGKKLEAPSRKVSIDVRLDEIVLRALEQKPEMRFQQASVLKTQVEDIAQAEKAESGIPLRRATARQERKAENEPHFWQSVVKIGIWAAIIVIAVIMAMLAIKSYYFPPTVVLTQAEFLDKFQANEIAHATISLRGQGSMLTSVTGTYFKTDKDGKVTKEEVPFSAPYAFFTKKRLDVLLASGKVETDASNRSRDNLVRDLAPFLILGAGAFLLFVLIVAFIIRRIWRAVNRPKNSRVPAEIDAWLALMDRGDFAGTWQTASPMFQAMVSEEVWVGKCVKIRKPLGKVISREVKTSGTAGLGKLFKAQFITRFDGGFETTETVNFSRQADGSWKAASYIVRIGTELARDWRRAFWIVFVVMMFALLVTTGVDLAVNLFTPKGTQGSSGNAAQSAAGQLLRSKFPIGMQVSTNNTNAYVVHDNVDAYYTLFHDGGFKSVTCRGWNNLQQGNWQDDYAITLADGDRTFGFLRESLDPDQLRVNGQDYDLRQGRVLVLNPDGTVRQLPLFPPLAVAKKVDELAGLIHNSLAGDSHFKFGPVAERILNLNELGLTDVLNLDSGVTVPPPKLKSPLDAAFASVVMPTGVAVISQTAQHPMMLLGRQASVAPYPEENHGREWNELAPQTLAASFTSSTSLENSADTASAFGELPNTFMFKTLGGRIGMLQITGFTDSPRGVKIRYKLVEENSTSPAAGDVLSAQPPVVVETFPVSGARDIEPGETEMRIRFSQPMMAMLDGSVAWTSEANFSVPEVIGDPYYDTDGRTCVAKVKLEARKTYALWVNSDQFSSFKNPTGLPAVPYLLIFQTKQK